MLLLPCSSQSIAVGKYGCDTSADCVFGSSCQRNAPTDKFGTCVAVSLHAPRLEQDGSERERMPSLPLATVNQLATAPLPPPTLQCVGNGKYGCNGLLSTTADDCCGDLLCQDLTGAKACM